MGVKRLAGAAVAAGVVAVAPLTPAGAAAGVVFGGCNGGGVHAYCDTGAAVVFHPRGIRARVSSPGWGHNPAFGGWVMYCGRGGRMSSGSYSGVTPFTRRLPKPFPYPSGCSVDAWAQVTKGHSVHIVLHARVR